jgi:WD40 repeat protein
MLYAREEEPKNLGHIGIYDRATDRQLKAVKVTQQPEGDSPNEIKGLAWSPDSSLLAVMYHWSGGSSISILDVKQGKETARLSIKSQPHSVEFSSQTKLKAGDELIERP